MVLLGGAHDRTAEFMPSERYDQHAPNIAGGLKGPKAHVAQCGEPGRLLRYWRLHRLIGQGDVVVTKGHVQIGRSHYCVFDIFRLSEGLIVEHWDVQGKMLPPEEWSNQGKF